MNVGTATGHFGVTTRITRVGFADGWTGALAIGTIVYVLGAIFVAVADLPPSPGLDFYRLVSDQPAAFAAALLAIVAARQAQQPSARKTWKFIAAAIVTYNIGNLIDALPADRGPDAVSVAGRPVLPRVLPGPVHGVHGRRARQFAARVLGTAAARLADPGAGIRHLLLVLRDQPGGCGQRGGTGALRAGPDVHRLRLRDAHGDRRAAHEQLALPAAARDARAADRRVRDDVPRRHRLGDSGRRELVLLRRELLGRPVSRLLCRSCRRGAGADPRQVATGAPARRGRRRPDAGHRLRRTWPVLLRARVLRGRRRKGHGDDHDRGDLRARRAGHGPAERDPARRRQGAPAQGRGPRRGPLRVADPQCLGRDHDRGRRRPHRVRVARHAAHFRPVARGPGRPQAGRDLARGGPRAHRRVPCRGHGDPGRSRSARSS